MYKQYGTEDHSISLGYRKSSNSSQSRHFHVFNEMLFILDGMRDMFVGNRSLSLKKGDLVIISPESLHKSLGNTQDSEIYSLYFPAHMILIQENQSGLIQISSENRISGMIEKELKKMEREFQEKKPCWEQMVHSILDHICVLINRYEPESSPDSPTNHLHERMSEVASFVKENSSENLSLDLLAEKFYLSQSYLSRSFHSTTGFTFIEYLNHNRILKAQNMLRDTNEKISVISEACGFGSVTHFGRIFKSLAEMTPRQYRKSMAYQ